MFINFNSPAPVQGIEELPSHGENTEEALLAPESAFADTLFTFQKPKGTKTLPSPEVPTAEQPFFKKEERPLSAKAHSEELPHGATLQNDAPLLRSDSALTLKESAPLSAQEAHLRTTPEVAQATETEPTTLSAQESFLRTAPPVQMSAKESVPLPAQEPVLRTALEVAQATETEPEPAHAQSQEPFLRNSQGAEKERVPLPAQEPVLRTSAAAVPVAETIHPSVPAEEPALKTAFPTKDPSVLQKQEPLFKIAPAVAPLDPSPLPVEEPLLRTAAVTVTNDQAQSSILPQDDSVARLKEQVSNMPQLTRTGTEMADSPQAEEAPSSLNTHFVFRSAQRQKPEGVDQKMEQVGQYDPRMERGEAKIAERTKVTVEAQLDQANFQLSMGKSAESDSDSLTPAVAFRHGVPEEPEPMSYQKMKQQFRAIPLSDSLEQSNPQPLREFSQNMNFDAALNPSGKLQDFEAPRNAPSKNAFSRNVPNLAEVFTQVKQEEGAEPAQTFTELDTQFDPMMRDSSDKLETNSVKEGRLVSELNPARTGLKEPALDLEQIMSKVHVKDKGTQEVILQLAPKELGNLKMTIRQEGNDLSVEMIVANPEVKQILEANLPELRARFLAQEEASFDQLQFAVDVEQHSFSQSGQSPDRGGFEEDYFSQKQQEAEGQVPVSEQYRKAGYNSGVSVYA